MPPPEADHPTLGVVVVTYAAADVIATCLETLMGAKNVKLRVVVIDNGSPDNTCETIRAWASGSKQVNVTLPFDVPAVSKPIPLDGSGSTHHVTLVETGTNSGFAGGVNKGLALLAQDPEVDRFWILNPDCAVPPDTPALFASAPDGFSLMGGRIVFLDDPDKIQIDGGHMRWATGVTYNAGYLQDPASTPAPDPTTLDFISGASMVASRAFYESVGPMQEDYFLYYEEVDWAQRRNAPLAYAHDAVVYHEGGASIGSRTTKQEASALSLYFIYRARVKYLWRFWKFGIPGAMAYSFAKAVQFMIRGEFSAGYTLMLGAFQLPPPKDVRQKLKGSGFSTVGK